ncbi:uncharacterized protein LOC128883073 [Hylaeus volcanicus]|uniref:uncharacterized protein LOC128883073 n=1 Tax=Hylaeus volcanicus TaxID=313075 RepID=UPI0023B7CD1F|nr:uncharacterized protein LOC128883073 [Hylaeus volcanicus]
MTLLEWSEEDYFVRPLPRFPQRIAVDVFYDHRKYLPGDVFRCHIEIRPPSFCFNVPMSRLDEFKENFTLDLFTAQFIGVCTVKDEAYLHYLNLYKESTQLCKIEQNHFYCHLKNQCNEMYPKISSFQKKKDLVFTDSLDHTPSTRVYPDICYDPIHESNKVLFVKSSPHCIAEKQSFFPTEESFDDSQEMVATYAFECLIPLDIPPTFIGDIFSYTYFISFVMSRNRSCAEKIFHILAPVILGGSHHSNTSQPKCIVDTCFDNGSPDQQRKLSYKNTPYSTFNFRSHSWKGGTPQHQYKKLQPLTTKTVIPYALESLKEWYYPTSESRIEVVAALNELGKYTSNATAVSSHQILHMAEDTVRLSYQSNLIAELHLFKNNEKLQHSSNKKLDPLFKVYDPTYYVTVYTGDEFIIHFDFTNAVHKTFEIHSYIIREEIPREDSREKNSIFPFQRLFQSKRNTTDVHRKIILCDKQIVVNQTQCTVFFPISSSWCPTMSSTLVKVKYFLLFKLLCAPLASQLSDEILQVFWTTGINIFTQHTTNDHGMDFSCDIYKTEATNDEKNENLFPMYSNVENICNFGPRAYQAHKAFLI